MTAVVTEHTQDEQVVLFTNQIIAGRKRLALLQLQADAVAVARAEAHASIDTARRSLRMIVGEL